MEVVGSTGKSRLACYETADGVVEIFLEAIAPPLPLLVFGAGHDAIPVVQIGKLLGWHVSVFDTRPAYVNHSRLAAADRLVLTRPDHVFGGVSVDSHGAAVVMNHNYPLDRFVLGELLQLPLRYIGVLGPRARTEKMLADLKIEKWPPNLYAPIGLDIGAETPEAIALAIAAEIQAVVSGREAGSLRKRAASIYAPAVVREVVA
jgi:xanthine/CO dehydrogenase XdhC/CoxF family maturation factor